MASDVGVGDSELGTLNVAPADGTTSAVCTVTGPAGTPVSFTATGGPLLPIEGSTNTQQLWTTDQPITYVEPGRWVLHWDVTGTGQGAEDFVVHVVASPVAGGPTWLPGRSRVATYVPHRTLARSTASTVASADEYVFGFDSTTIPTGVQVDRLIMDGVDWVSTLVTPLNVKSQPLAALVSALWAGIAVERGWPDDDQSLARANDMEKQLNLLLAELKAANLAANTTDGVQSVPPAVLPAWSFPPSDLRWDSSCYF